MANDRKPWEPSSLTAQFHGVPHTPHRPAQILNRHAAPEPCPPAAEPDPFEDAPVVYATGWAGSTLQIK